MRTAPAVFIAITLSACGLGCGSNGASGPVVMVFPASKTVSTGDTATTFQASLSNGAVDPVTWTLTGPGSISVTTGDQTSYQPPDLGASGGTAMLRATAGCGAGCVPVGDTATITIATAATGRLNILVQVPAAMTANLTVTGPNGFTQNVTTGSSVTFSSLVPGTYNINGATIPVTDPIVTSQYTAAPVAATVTANAIATATVTYAAPPGYGMLWTVGASANTLAGFTSGDLQASQTPTVTPGTGGPVQGIAFDAAGNLWASLGGAPGSVVSYAPAGLASDDTLTPSVTLNDANISDPAGVALGPDGRLWVANCPKNSVSAYPLTGGSASLTISSLSCPRGIAFDDAGNLWVANANGAAERFPSNQIQASNATPAADVVLTPPSSPASSQPYGIALDTNGDVWVSFCAGSTVAHYLSATFPGTTTPDVALTPTTSSPVSLDCPVALALDNSGQLWVANLGASGTVGATLSRFALADMLGGGAALPVTQVPGLGVTVGGLALNPTPTGLPLRH